MQESDPGPRIISQNLPDHIRIQKSKNMQYYCNAIGQETQYQWLKDLQVNLGSVRSLKMYYRISNGKIIRVGIKGVILCVSENSLRSERGGKDQCFS